MERYSEYKDSGLKWLGDVPSHWEVKRLASYFSERKVKVSDQDYPPLSVTKSGIFPQLDNVAKSNDGDNRKQVLIDDFVINSRSDRKGSSGVSKYTGSVSLINIVLKPRNTVFPGFCNYLLKCRSFIEEYYRNGRGIVADLWTTRYDEMKMIKIPMPSIEEQKIITSYLDTITSKIDDAIVQQQKMIDLLNERKQIIINNAVTKGIDPTVPMKDSGIEWIGKIPKNWTNHKLKFCVRLKGRIGWNGLKSEEFKESSYAYLVTGQDFINSEIKWSKCYQIDKARYDEDPYIQLSNGDLLVTKDGSIGKIAKVTNLDKPACLNSGIFVLKQRKDLFNQDYLYWMLCSNVLSEYVRYTQTGATILHLYQYVFEQMPCLIPSLKEQKQIATFLNKKCGELDLAVIYYSNIIIKLQERKQIIINDVVTGKVKIS